MITANKLKWLGSIILAGVFLVMAVIGSDWGTNYTANASVNADPIIYLIQPPKVPVRSPDKIIVVSGLNFGDKDNTGVRLSRDGFDTVLRAIDVGGGGISVSVTNTLMTETTVYTLTVVRSDYPSIPSVPLYPEWDHESNSLPFTIFQAEEYFLPIIRR
jgi:hypothetical protein